MVLLETRQMALEEHLQDQDKALMEILTMINTLIDYMAEGFVRRVVAGQAPPPGVPGEFLFSFQEQLMQIQKRRYG